MSVGKSGRTPGKHDALDKYLGKQAGVISCRFTDRRIVFVDCTAGDGQADDFDRHTSPGIMLRHASWLRQRSVQVDVLLFERSPKNAKHLQDKVGDAAQVFATSSADLEKCWGDNDLLFVSNDPNTIADWALPSALADAPALTTVFSTLGCNVGGLKRLPLDQRMQWYEHVKAQMQLCRHWHDAMLCRLVNDSSQWAYLVNSPAKWRAPLNGAFQAAFDRIGYDTAINWWRKEPSAYSDAIDSLFLTRSEYRAKTSF